MLDFGLGLGQRSTIRSSSNNSNSSNNSSNNSSSSSSSSGSGSGSGNGNNNGNNKIYLCTEFTDMRKGVNCLSFLAESLVSKQVCSGAMFVFRGKNASKIKILWWDGQGFCLFYKSLDSGKFTWPKSTHSGTIGLTKAQLSMLIEGIDWRNPSWSSPPLYVS